MNKNIPTIDVVVPVYNGMPFVERTLKSIVAQTLKPTNIIIVNDGSTDDTFNFLKKFQVEHANFSIHIIDKPNGGHSTATNAGIQVSKSEFVALVDADDLWHPSKLEKQLQIFFQSPFKENLGVVYCNFDSIDENDQPLPHYNTIKLDPEFRGRVFEKLITKGCFIAGSNSAVMIRRSIFDELGFFDENLKCGEDWDMWIRISEQYFFDFSPETLTSIRRHQNNLSKQKMIHLKSDLYVINKWRHAFSNIGGRYIFVDYLARNSFSNLKELLLAPSRTPNSSSEFSSKDRLNAPCGLLEMIQENLQTNSPKLFILFSMIVKIFKRVQKIITLK